MMDMIDFQVRVLLQYHFTISCARLIQWIIRKSSKGSLQFSEAFKRGLGAGKLFFVQHQFSIPTINGNQTLVETTFVNSHHSALL